MMQEELYELYWSEIPIGRENACSYDYLCKLWMMDARSVRRALHFLSSYDNGDNLILIRSSNRKGFYRTDDKEDIAAYRAECLNRGRRTLTPLKKIDRVLSPDFGQISMENNLKAVRTACGLSAAEVCEQMSVIDPYFDAPMLSRMENGRCMPTPLQLAHLAAIYRCTPQELVNTDLFPTAF